jgi:hypothetical protein
MFLLVPLSQAHICSSALCSQTTLTFVLPSESETDTKQDRNVRVPIQDLNIPEHRTYRIVFNLMFAIGPGSECGNTNQLFFPLRQSRNSKVGKPVFGVVNGKNVFQDCFVLR